MLLTALVVAASAAAQESLRSYRDFAAKREGSAERGRAVFFARDKAGCSLCHSVDGSASRAGPDLFAIGDKFPRRELIEAILDPNATIAVGYGATIVETTAGESFLGVIKQANQEGLELMAADGQVTRLSNASIRERRSSPRSLMPENLQAALTLQEFADLIEFLATRREARSLSAGARGMPDPIPELTRPVTLRPFVSEEMRFPASVVKRPGDVRAGPVWMVPLPDQANAFLVVHQSGRIWRLEKNPRGDIRTLFADFSADVFSRTGPNGLLGLALHPRFSENRKYYVKHQVGDRGQIATALFERRAAADGRTDSGEPARPLLKIDAVTINHTGGTIAFGPDGYLYLGMGDTGPQQDPNGHGQNRQLLLGKILRIDIDRRDEGREYAIPRDNPFRTDAATRPEIWALGFREPWRFSFDRVTGDLWVGDVGQDRVEEVDLVRRGENLGWNVVEGFEPFSNRFRREEERYVAPVFAYKRHYGNSITGGYVYRGDPDSSFHGVYICGDYTSRLIFGVVQRDRELLAARIIGRSPEGIASFAEDAQGHLYLVGYEGMIYRIDFEGARFE